MRQINALAWIWCLSRASGIGHIKILCGDLIRIISLEKVNVHLLSAVFYKNHPGHGDQVWTNFSKLGPYTSIDEPLFMAMKIPASVAPVFLDEICLISLI